MRYTAALTPPGSARPRPRPLRRALFTVAVVIALVWMAIAYAQEAYLGHRLGQQASDLERQNAQLAAQNQGYRRDIQALTNGSADEEEARLNGYSKPQERVYLVTSSPSPVTATPSPRPTPAPSPSQ